MEDRRVYLGVKWAEVAARGGISTETLRQIRSGASPMRPLTKRAVELGLAWTHGSVDRILNGDEPVIDETTENDIRHGTSTDQALPADALRHDTRVETALPKDATEPPADEQDIDPDIARYAAILADPRVPDRQKEIMRQQMRLWAEQVEATYEQDSPRRTAIS